MTGAIRFWLTTAVPSSTASRCATWWTKPRGFSATCNCAEGRLRMSTVVIVYELEGGGRDIVRDALDGVAEVIYLPDLDAAGRTEALRKADAVLARTTRELCQGEIALLQDVKLVQF